MKTIKKVKSGLWRRMYFFALLLLAGSLGTSAQTISSYLLGNNYWYPGADTKTLMAIGGKMDVANFQNIRIGGFGANNYTWANYLEYVKTIKAMGAQPIVQVKATLSAADAIGIITYLNITNGQNVRVWSIGNEPDHAGGGYLSDAQVQTYTKTIAAALKSVDPTIIVIGAEYAGYSASRYANLIGGDYSITGLVPGKDYYYVDVIGFHRYDMADASELNSNIADLVAKVNAANASRPAGKKLSWGMGEFNTHWDNNETTDPNKKTYSFNAGQLFAELYGKGMANGAFFMNAWSIYEGKAKDPATGLNTIDRTGTDLSLFDVYTTGYKERSSYWHSSMIGQNMRANYATSTDNQTTVGIVAMKDANGASVMIVNKNTTTAFAYTLRLDNGALGTGGLQISVNAGINKTNITGNIGATTTQMLIFDATGFLKKRYTYTKANADARTGPYVENFTNTNVAPTSTLTAPANNTNINVNTAVTVSATATDSDGTISKVEFYAGATLIGTDTSSPYSISWTPTTAGTYAITAKATDNGGASTTSAASSLIVNAVVVYAPIPGTIQAEAYSNMFGIQTETTTDTGGGLNVGYVDADDWLDYTVNVSSAGAYNVSFRLASQVATGAFQLKVGATVLATVTVPNTGGWQIWQTITTPVTLSQGNQTLRIAVTGSGMNLNWIAFSKVNTPPVVTLTAPANNTTINVNTAVTVSATATDSDGTISKVEFYAGATLIGTDTSSPYSINWTPTTAGTYAITAKATDNGGASTTSAASSLVVSQIVYAPIPGTIQAEAYSNMFGIQTETTTDVGGGLNVGWTEAGDWMDYTVNVQSAGNYTVSFRVASQVATGKIELRNQAGTALATLTQGTTGGWQTWVTSNVTANLAAGNQTLRVHYTGAGLNLNWVQFTKVNTPPTVSLTAPANNTSVYVNTAVTVSANAADTDGTISKVDFYAGATLIGTDTSSPYSISWTPTTVGTYAITAKATDNGGVSTTSTAVTLTAAAATTIVTLNPTADAYVRGGTYAATNFGTTADLYVKTAPEADGLYTRRAYLKFSVAGMSGIQNAVVRLYAGTATPFSVKVNQTTDAWTETAINWNTAPATGTLIATTAVTAAGVYYEWNVTSFVQSQAAGDGVVSLVFSDAATTNQQIIFNSREATANKPQLVVTSSGLKSADLISDIEEISTKEVKIFPNPVCDELHIQNVDQNSTIEIFNLAGKLVFVEKTVAANNTLNISALKSGMYILKANCDNRPTITKFVKK
jgi:hypothetical protein